MRFDKQKFNKKSPYFSTHIKKELPQNNNRDAKQSKKFTYQANGIMKIARRR